MTLVRPQDLSFMAGGAVAQRHGVFVRRTSPTEDVAEVFARSSTAPRFDENGVVRNAAIDVPRLSWRDFDGDGVYEQAVLPIGPQTTNLIEFNVPGGTPSDFELSPITVTNLTAEYYIELDEGDSLDITAPANWTEDDWAFEGWLRSSWPNTDGLKRVAWEAKYDGTNYIQIYKDSDDALKCNVVVGGVDNITTLTLAISAGDEFFLGARLNSGSLTLYVDTDGDTTLNTNTDGSVGALPAGAWTFYFVADSAGVNPWEGGLNVAILNDGSSADPITERFNSGNGTVAEKEWFSKYSDKLVLYVPNSSAVPLNGIGTPAVTRNDSGRFYDWEGLVTAVSADILRNRNRVLAGDGNSYRCTLLEKGFTNLNDEDDLQNWFKSATPVITPNVSDPAGGTAAFTVEDNAGGANEYIEREFSYTGDGVKSFFIAIRENSHPGVGAQEIRIIDTDDGGASRFRLAIDSWSAGEPQITEHEGTVLFMFESYDGYWILLCQTEAITAANTNMTRLHPAAVTGQVGSFDVYLCGAVNSVIPPQSLLSESETTTADLLYKDFTAVPQEMTIYARFIELGTAQFTDDERIFHIGSVTFSANPRLFLQESGGNYRLRHINGVGDDRSSTMGVAPEIGDLVELRGVLAANGSVRLHQSINGGREVSASGSSAATLQGAWAGERFYMNSAGPSKIGLSAFIDVKVESGTQDLATMQALTAPDLFHYASGQEDELLTLAWDTATKGDAIPGIDGLGGPWGIADASSVVASSEGIPLPYDTDFGTTVMKLESGPAGSGTRRYLFGLPGTLNSFTPNTLGGMVVGVYIPSSSEITPAQVTTHAVDDQGSSAGDVATATDRWEWLWASRTWDGSATEAYLELRFADGVSLSGADEVLYMAIPTGVDGTIPLVPIPQIAEGTSVVEEEDFYAAFEIPPGVAGFYVELIAWAPGGLLYIGAAGDSGARLMLEYATDGTLLIFFSDGSSTSQKASASTVSPGSNIKVLGTVTATGILQITISIDDAAEEQSALSSALALPDDWGDQRAYLGSKGGGDHATVEILEAKAIRDSIYTLAEVGAVV